MYKLLRSFCLVSVLALGMHASNAFAEDHDIAVADLPKAVTESIAKRFPDAKLVAAEKEITAGKVHYEVKLQDKAQAWHKVNVLENGEITKEKATNND